MTDSLIKHLRTAAALICYPYAPLQKRMLAVQHYPDFLHGLDDLSPIEAEALLEEFSHHPAGFFLVIEDGSESNELRRAVLNFCVHFSLTNIANAAERQFNGLTTGSIRTIMNLSSDQAMLTRVLFNRHIDLNEIIQSVTDVIANHDTEFVELQADALRTLDGLIDMTQNVFGQVPDFKALNDKLTVVAAEPVQDAPLLPDTVLTMFLPPRTP